jgi:hypothetical protein
VLACIIEEHNGKSTEPNKIELYAVSDDACYRVTTKLTQAPNTPLNVQTLFIHNINNMHWEAYGPKKLGSSSYIIAAAACADTSSTGDDGKAPSSSAAAAASADASSTGTDGKTPSPSTAAATPANTTSTVIDGKALPPFGNASLSYKEAEVKFRIRRGISADVPVDPEQVKQVYLVDEGPVIYDSDSEHEEATDNEPKPQIETQPQPETQPGDTEPTTFESAEQVMSLVPIAGLHAIPHEAQLVRIQNPSAASDDWVKVATSHKFRCKIKILKRTSSRTKTPWLPIKQSNKDGVTMRVSVKSSDLAPSLSISAEIYRKNNSDFDNGVQLPKHRGSIDFSFGRVYKDAQDTSTEPNQIMNLQVKYGSEYTSAILDFDTTGATANNIKCIADFPEPNLHPLLKIRPRQDEFNLCKKLASLTTGKAYHITVLILPDAEDFEAHKNGLPNAIDAFFAILPHKNNSPSGSTQ